MELQFALEEMHFHACHGVFEEEVKVGNQFIVSVKYTLEIPQNHLSDNLEDTIDCAEVYQVVKEEMQIRSQLIEHVSWRIARRLLESFQKMTEVEVKVSKCHPPLPGEVERSSAKVILQKF